MKILKVILSLCMIFVISVSGAAFAEDEGRLISVFVDGEKINFDQNPILDNGRTLVPMRFIFEALGAEVGWDDATQTATAVKGDITISITINKPELVKNGNVIVLDVPAKLVNDRTLVPVRAVSEGMNAKVEWIDETSSVIITNSSANGTYSRSELSVNDMNKLVANTDKYLKNFEQNILPASTVGNTNLSAKILEKDNSALDFVKNLWLKTIITEIQNIQDSSADIYEYTSVGSTPADIMKNAVKDYVSLADKSGIGADQVVKKSEYKEMNDGSVMLSVECVNPKNGNTLYIGIIANSDGSVKCSKGNKQGNAIVYN